MEMEMLSISFIKIKNSPGGFHFGGSSYSEGLQRPFTNLISENFAFCQPCSSAYTMRSKVVTALLN